MGLRATFRRIFRRKPIERIAPPLLVYEPPIHRKPTPAAERRNLRVMLEAFNAALEARERGDTAEEGRQFDVVRNRQSRLVAAGVTPPGTIRDIESRLAELVEI